VGGVLTVDLVFVATDFSVAIFIGAGLSLASPCLREADVKRH